MEYIPGVQKEMDATNCSTLVHLSDTGMASEARPRGLAIDQDNHLWLAVEQNEGQGAILEINTDTGAVVSTIGNLAKTWHIQETLHQPNKYCSYAQFCYHWRCGKFHFGQETPITYKFVPKMNFSWEQMVATKGQEGCPLGGKKAPHAHFLGQI